MLMATDVNRSILLTGALIISLSGSAQTKEITLTLRNESIETILKSIEDQAGLYFSYDPAIFYAQPKQSVYLVEATLQEALSKVLSPRFQFKLIGENIVITVNKGAQHAPTRSPVIKKESGADKPIALEEEKGVAKYDTREVVRRIEVVDTIYVEKVKFVFDTVRPSSVTSPTKGRSLSWVPQLAGLRWSTARGARSNEQVYNGIRVGVAGEVPIRRMVFSVGLDYNYLFRNFTYPTDSSNVFSDSLSTSERVNTLSLLAGRLGLGYDKVFGRTKIGVRGGVGLYKVLHVDELRLQHSETSNSTYRSDYRPMLVNASVSLMIRFPIRAPLFVVLSPFLEYGLNDEYPDEISNRPRRAYGLSIGISTR